MRVHPAAEVGALPTCISFVSGGGEGEIFGLGRETVSSFEVDGVAGPEMDQGALYALLGAPAVANVLAGFNACIMAYGRSGSGKTHTVLGVLGSNPDMLHLVRGR